MNTQLTGTLIDNSIRLDQPLNLPNHSRVTVDITCCDEERQNRAAAWARLKSLIHSQKFNSGGALFTRDELYERD